MLTKQREKKLDGNYTRILCAVLNKIFGAAPHKITAIRPPTPASYKLSKKNEQDLLRTTGEAKDELISDVLL